MVASEVHVFAMLPYYLDQVFAKESHLYHHTSKKSAGSSNKI